MEFSLFKYSQKEGWSVDDFPRLDSEKTLVLIFGAQEYIDKKELFTEIANAYPKSHIVGCSTAGEIFNNQVSDKSLAVALSDLNP